MFDKILDFIYEKFLKMANWCINAPTFKKGIRRLPALIIVAVMFMMVLIPVFIIFSVTTLFIKDSYYETLEDDWKELGSAWNEFIESLGF